MKTKYLEKEYTKYVVKIEKKVVTLISQIRTGAHEGFILDTLHTIASECEHFMSFIEEGEK